ncbi:hypothetical protein PoMZ_13656 [Pyricularia oryzae]|uniref:Uncharacterized protein n=1 Tax=Pyricularia oryzae TaxID=318829 RepID=A0A4P7NW07_PYROR|nr:hypothetical protein PoMZ_13656 [Pyricularia oryzae]
MYSKSALGSYENCQPVVQSCADIRSLSKITMELMQGYCKENGRVGVDDLVRWPADSRAVDFLSVTADTSDLALLSNHPLLKLPWNPRFVANVIRNFAAESAGQKRNPSERLGVSVQPSDVRLNPGKNDPYRWKFIPGEEETLKPIFAKNLSDHSTGIYQLLCYGVGKRFEAVPAENATPPFQSATTLLPTGTSFTDTIENLSEENGKLCKEVDDLKRRLEVEENTRWKMEEENRQMQVSQAELQFQLQQLLGFVENLRVNVSNYCRGMDQVVPLLEELKRCGIENIGHK